MTSRASPPSESSHSPEGPGDGTDDRPDQWYREISDEVGIDFTYQSGATGEQHIPELMGAGAALFDFDNDGDLDIYLTNGAVGLTRALSDEDAFSFSPAPGGPVNRLLQQEPDGKFVDVSEASGLDDPGYGMGVAIGDVNNDGFADVYLTNFGQDKLYQNRGDGTFENVTAAAGIAVNGWSSSAAFVDYDRDGYLDLFVTRYVSYVPRTECSTYAGEPEYCGPTAFRPVHDVLLHNKGDGTFEDVSESAGIAAIAAAGLGVICADLNDDQWPDIYVANDAYANHLWMNQRDGTFTNKAIVRGVAFNWQGAPEAGMGVVAADLDNDLDLDLFMTHLRRETNTFYRNDNSKSGFVDVTARSGLGSSSLGLTGFGTAAFDVELDGDLDLPVVNGRVLLGETHAGCALGPPWNNYAEPNLFFLNDGKGNFSAANSTSAFCDPVEISRGLAIGDFDSDGDMDLLVCNIEGPTRLYRNVAERKGHWLMVAAMDPKLKRHAIGAVVTVHCGEKRQVRNISRAVGYLSSSDPRAHFGLGDAKRIDKVVVRWPDGLEESFADVPLDSAITVRRGEGRTSK